MAIPSSKWYPTSLQDRAAWHQNFTTQFAAVAPGLGFLPADVVSVQTDNVCIQGLAQAAVQIDAYASAVRHYRIVVTEGTVGEPTPAFPAGINPAPEELPPTGIFQRLIELVDRIRVAPAYTNETGALLGIIPSPSGNASGNGTSGTDVLKPVIKAGQSFDSYKFSVNVTRLGMEAFKVQVQKGGGAWADAAFATNNPCEVVISPQTPGQPERVLVRAILLQKNQPVGEPSDPTYVTVNP